MSSLVNKNSSVNGLFNLLNQEKKIQNQILLTKQGMTQLGRETRVDREMMSSRRILKKKQTDEGVFTLVCPTVT